MTIQLEHTPEELATMLDQMQALSHGFYRTAQKIGYHEFLEITGFMNEMINICRRAAAQGIDFATGSLPPVETHEAAYIGEKVGCIFKHTFAGKPELVQAFCRSAFGVDVSVNAGSQT